MSTTTADTPTGQAVERQKSGGEAMIEQYKGSFAMVLPSHVKPDMFIRLSQGLLRRDEKLRKAANANPGSFLSALLDCARLGLEPGDTYHLVPFGNEVTGIVDYTGEIELVYRAGAVSSVKAELVYSNDSFRWNPGTMDRPDHTPPINGDGEPDWFANRGDLVGVYGYAEMKGGGTSRVVLMPKAEVLRHKAVSKSSGSSSSPWQKWPESMWLKTVVKQVAKWVPSSAEYRSELLRSELAAQEQAGVLGVSLPIYDAPDLPEPTGARDEDIVDAEVVDDDTTTDQQTLEGAK